MSHAILAALDLADAQSGTYLGQGKWSKTTDAGTLQPVNPATGEVIASGARNQRRGIRDYRRARAGSVQGLAHDAGAVAWRSGSSLRRSAAQTQGCARFAGRLRDGQDQARRRWRSAGDDRHRRFRSGSEPHDVRRHDALGAPGPPHVRPVPSAWPGRHHQRVQFPGSGVGMERHAGRRSPAISASGSRRRRRRCRPSPRSRSATRR